MSIFSWLFSKPVQKPKPASAVQRQVAQQKQPVTPPAGVSADLKQQRQDRRDHLYSVVRDAMLRSEVLASHYKFKVLSLDTQGRQFLVMMDLLGEQILHPQQLIAIETMISHSAAQRYALQVKAVYWRQAEPAAPPVAVPSAVAAPSPVVAAAAPRPPLPVVPDVVAPTPRGRGGVKTQGFDPIGADEVLAFKNAIGAHQTPVAPEATGQPQVSGLRNAAAMTGFEDTQLLEPDETVSPLSRTQFGDL